MDIILLFLPLSIILFLCFFSLLVIRKDPRAEVNLVFLFLIFSSILWILFNFLIDISGSTEHALFLSRLTIIGPALWAPLVLYFSLIFPRVRRKISKLKIVVMFVPALIVLCLTPTKYNVIRVWYGPRGIDFQPGVLYIVLVFYLIFYFIATIRNFVSSYLSERGIKRMQILYVLGGFFLTLILGIVMNAILPILGYGQLVSVGPSLSLIFFSSFTTYAIIRHRFLDIRVIVKKGTVYLLSLLVAVGTAIAGTYGIARVAGAPIDARLLVGGALMSALALLSFSPAKRAFEKIANKYLFVSLYDYQETVKSLGQQLTWTIDLTKIIDTIIKSTADVMKLDKAGVLLRDEASGVYQIQKIVGFKEENGISLVKDNFLTEYLQKTGKSLVHEELRLQIRDAANSELRQRLSNLRDNMKKIEAAICLPLFREAEIQGLIVLGNKISKDAYSSQDIELLETLASQASVAIENGRLYDQVQDLTQHLQEKVDEQTKHLKKLFEVKTEFLHIVSHQLRTPLTALRGLLSMWSEGAFESYSPEEKQKVKQRISISCERLNNITNDMLDTLGLEEGYAKFILEPLDTAEIIDETVNFLKPNFDKKGLFLEFKKPEKSLPHVLGDKQYLPQSFQNLIDNAEKYTPKGGLTITLSQPDSNHIQISFKDTGIGVILQEKEHLFKDKFFRGERADKINTAGSGLGLYIVKNIIDGHHGTVGIKSAGPNQGTEFIVSLPVAK